MGSERGELPVFRTRFGCLLAIAAAGIVICSGAAAAATTALASTTVRAQVATPVPGVSALRSIACPTINGCVTVGTDSNLNGKSAVITAATGAVKVWSGTLTSEPPNAVACPAAATSCLAVADDAVITVNVSTGAMKVTAKPKPPTGGIEALSSIACASKRNCYAVGFQGPHVASTAVLAHISGAGKLLSRTTGPGSGFSAIACPSSALCLISDFNSPQESIVLLNSGHLGTSHPFPASTYVQALSCYKGKLCYALGGNSSATPAVTDELFPVNPATGAIGTMATIGGGFSGTSLACLSASRCLVAGFTGSGSTGKAAAVAVNSGTPGSPVSYAGSSFSGVACASATECYAVGQNTAGAIVDKVKP
jgi:hypothetical protein